MPCRQLLNTYITEYVKAASLEIDPKGYLFQSIRGRIDKLTGSPLAQPDVYRMIRRRAIAAAIRTKIGSHTFRVTGITQRDVVTSASLMSSSWCPFTL
jgi:integrase/recombinase XerD